MAALGMMPPPAMMMGVEQRARMMQEHTQQLVQLSISEFQRLIASAIEKFTINVAPLAHNPMEFHFNVWPTSGAFRDIPIHGSLIFPRDYPRMPPRVGILTDVMHPKIVFEYDMRFLLLDSAQSGVWNPTFPPISFNNMMQELMIIFDDLKDPDSHKVSAARDFFCAWCGHQRESPNPKLGVITPPTPSISASAEEFSINNRTAAWRDAIIPDNEVDFAAFFFKVTVDALDFGQNGLTSMSVGWVVKDSYADWDEDGSEPEMYYLTNKLVWHAELSQHGATSKLMHKKPFEIADMQLASLGPFNPGDYVHCGVSFDKRQFQFFVNGTFVGVLQMPEKPKNIKLQPFVGLNPNCAVRFSAVRDDTTPDLLVDHLSLRELSEIDRQSYLWDTQLQMDWMTLFDFGLRPSADAKDDIRGLHNAVLNIFNFLTEKEAASSRRVCSVFDTVLVDFAGSLGYSSKLKCCHSLSTYKEGEILGLMFRFDHAKQSKPKAGRFVLRNVVFSEEYAGLKAWDSGKQKDSSDERFRWFLPMIVEQKNEGKVMGVLKKKMGKILPNGFEPAPAARLLCALMDGVVNSFAEQWRHDDAISTRTIKHSLTVWSNLHYILLVLRKRYPSEIIDDADAQLRQWTSKMDELSRNKVPSLGYALAVLTISEKIPAKAVFKDWFLEMCARDVENYIGREPGMMAPDYPSEKRYHLTYSVSSPMRKFGFAHYFFNLVLSSKNSTVTHAVQIEEYNSRMGAPAAESVTALGESLDSVIEARDWAEYMRLLRVSIDPTRMTALLYNAQKLAIKNRYFDAKRLPAPKGPSLSAAPPAKKGSSSPRVRESAPSRGRVDVRSPREAAAPARTPRDRRSAGGDRSPRRDFPPRSGGRGTRGAPDDRRRYPEDRRRRDDYGPPRGGRRGGGRGGHRDGGRGGGRGRGGGPRDRRAGPMPKHVSEYASKFYEAAAVSSVGELPEWMQPAIKENVRELNAMQKEIVPLITAGQPAFCFSPAGTGKSTAAAIGALYRVFVKKDPSQVLIITPTPIMATEIGQLCKTLGAGVPDLHVFSLLRDRSVPDAAKIANGRNIFVAPPRIALMLFERCGEMLSDNCVAAIVMSCEVQLGKASLRGTFDLFRKVPASIPVTLFASAWNTELEAQAREILPDAATPVVDHRASHKVNHWYSLSAYDMKREVLIKAAKENPLKQGLIFVDKTSDANEINSLLNKSGVTSMAVGVAGFKRELANAISRFQASEVQYLVVAANAALNSLWRTKAQLIINFNIQSYDQYSSRSAVVSSEGGKAIEMITIISTDRADFFDGLETSCGIEMLEVSQHLDGGFKPLASAD